MTQIIDVTNGEARYLVATVTERNGEALTGSTIQVGLGGYDTKPSAWLAPSVSTVDGATATVKLLVNNVAQIGTERFLWVKVTDNPEVLPVCCRNDSVTIK